ncbi:MAG: MBL fold metallo-hydrolase [Candidatus Tokpelaia hoelldobleri]|uniref:MBL fold metallo-hydrolase n=1 Tax=Candidatus Tokpelaia hoelldobleri TaxID=1902579 RepID=A0A1U9JV94_9HYPH|nr:MAG: MBL fold metallo-hydrolase [Candidatus Tokpelaia hoelldoblerii]
MSAAQSAEFVFLPLGGVGEIGMNLAAYGYGPEDKREWLIVDMGVSFAGEDLPGADLILPDIRFLENERHNIRALVLTHAHEDHFGAVLDLWPRLKVPVYCTPFTAGLLETKRMTDFASYELPVQVFKAGDRFEAGAFAIEAIAVNHSIPDPVALAIRTPLGLAIHTGDWKIDSAPTLGEKTDEKRFRELGNEGVLALVCDSTNAQVERESITETEVSHNLAKIITEARGQVAITTFASNVGRVKSIALAAEAAGRRVLLVGRSMKRSAQVAAELGLMEGLAPFLSEEDYDSTPRDKIVLVLTGSQGEARAALAKIARDEMRDITLVEGDVIIYSSRSIPGNEKAIIETQNRLIDRGIEVITDHDAPVHVSGHPPRGHLRQMYEWTKPQILVPVHGEAMHLAAQAAFGEEMGISTIAEIRNGDMLRLAPGAVEVVDEVPVGRIYKDGKLLGDEDELGIRERRKLSYVGHVTVSFLLDKTGELAGEVQLVAYGLPETDGRGELMEDILFDAVEAAINNIPNKRRKDEDVVREAARKAVRSTVNGIWGKKTIVTVFLHRV